MRWLIGFIAVVALSIDGWGCAGRADDGSCEPGWVCGGECGLPGSYVDQYAGTCLCHGVVRPSVYALSGECIEYEWPEH